MFAAGWGMLFAALAVLMIGALVWTTALLQQSTAAVIRDMQALGNATDLERELLGYQRVSNMWVTTHEPELAEERARYQARLRVLAAEAARLVGSEREANLAAEAARHLRTYLDERQELEAQGLALPEILRRTRASLEASLASMRALDRMNREQVTRAQERAVRLDQLADRIAVLLPVFLAVMALAMALGVRRYIVNPVLTLQGTMEAYRAGDARVRAPGAALGELDEIVQTFNAMAEEIAAQRQNQLEFVSGVAHDLRSPLSALKLGVAMMRRDPTRITEERLQRFDLQLEAMTRMLGDLLDAMRIEAGALEIHLEPVDLREPAREIIELLEVTSERHELRLCAPEEPVMVQGDALRLGQVIGNLVSNAIKYSPAGGPVDVVVTPRDDWAEIAVYDEGIGIPPDEHEAIFAPFHRGRGPASELPGVGLGLSVVRRIVQAHGGNIEVESELGRGSTFTVRLPLRPDASARRHAEPRPAASPADPRPAEG